MWHGETETGKRDTLIGLRAIFLATDVTTLLGGGEGRDDPAAAADLLPGIQEALNCVGLASMPQEEGETADPATLAPYVADGYPTLHLVAQSPPPGSELAARLPASIRVRLLQSVVLARDPKRSAYVTTWEKTDHVRAEEWRQAALRLVADFAAAYASVQSQSSASAPPLPRLAPIGPFFKKKAGRRPKARR